MLGMLKKKRVSVAPGDIFVETLAGKSRIFRMLGLAPSVGTSFRLTWRVDSLMRFNGIPHARLIASNDDTTRIISVETLELQETYQKLEDDSDARID